MTETLYLINGMLAIACIWLWVREKHAFNKLKKLERYFHNHVEANDKRWAEHNRKFFGALKQGLTDVHGRITTMQKAAQPSDPKDQQP